VPFGGGSYEIRIKGRLSDSLLAAFEGLTATVEPVETVLHGPVQDQSSLHSLLDRIHSLGLELVEIRQLPGRPATLRPNPSYRREPPAADATGGRGCVECAAARRLGRRRRRCGERVPWGRPGGPGP
jgi:hypothetical protein